MSAATETNERQAVDTQLHELALNHTGYVTDKWAGYYPVYDQEFSRFKRRKIKV